RKQALGNGMGIVSQENLHQIGVPLPGSALPCSFCQRVGDGGKAVVQDLHQIDGVAPRIGLLHATGAGIARDQACQDQGCLVPADNVKGLERFVGKVERMAGIDVAVVGGGGEEH